MMIMVIIVSNNINNISVKPEVNRSRSLYINAYLVVDTVTNMSRGGNLNYEMVRDHISKMQAPEAVTAFEQNFAQEYRQSTVQREGANEPHTINLRFVDNVFWRVFEFDFVQGAPFTQEEFQSGVRRAVITQSMARSLFKGENPIGKNVLVDNIPYSVSGVVKDVSQVFKMAYGDVFAPYTSKQGHEKGSFSYLAILLVKKAGDYAPIYAEMKEVERKYESVNPNMDLIFTLPVEHAHYDKGSQIYTADYSMTQKGYKFMMNGRTVLLFLMLLLIPALNLSGFAVSRMKKRTEEIGVRKAFGARTGTVLFQVLYESIITSLIGGVIGLILSYMAVLLLKSWILGVGAGAAVPLGALVSPGIFLAVVLFCVLLGIMSSGIPALRAARRNIVKAIAKNDR
jgi:putative ABC transport system permease protein